MDEMNNNQVRRFTSFKAPSDTRDNAFLLVFFGFCVLSVWTILYGSFYFGFSLSNIVFLIIMTIYCRRSDGGSENKAFPLICGIFALIISILPTIYDSKINQLIIIAAVTLDCAYFDGMWGRCKYGYNDVRMIFDILNRLFIQTISKLITPFASITSSGERSRKKSKIILGLCISVPLVAVLIKILSESDAAFEGLVDRLISSPSEIVGVVILSLFLFPFIFSFAFSIRKNLDASSSVPSEHRIIDSTVFNTVLCAMSVVYGVYLFSQLSYFFSSFSGLLPENYSYAQYARRGFFELCVIAAINLVTVFVSDSLIKHVNGKRSRANKILSLFICIFTLVIIATSEDKIWLYILEYGMTINRIVPACFLIMLAFCFICAIIRIIYKDFPYMKILIVTASIMIIVFTVADFDKLIAHYNIDRYMTGTLFDLTGIEDLGSSATEEILKLTETDDKYANPYAKKVLSISKDRYYSYDSENDEYTNFKQSSNIGCFNLSRYREMKQLKDFYKYFDEDYNTLKKEFFIEIETDFECKEITVDYTIDGKISGTVSCMNADGSNLKSHEKQRFIIDEGLEKATDMNLKMNIYATLANGNKTLIAEGTEEYYINQSILNIKLTYTEKGVLDFAIDRIYG